MGFFSFTGFTRNTRRLSEIVSVLTRYGLSDWLSELNYDWLHGMLKSDKGAELRSYSQAQRLRMALTELGTTFIKFGQMLSTRPDLVGAEIAEELESLQGDTPPDAFEDVKRLMEEELERPLDEMFEVFEEKPVASASIGQVHRATLNTGQPVVVKVRHVGIEDRIHSDLEIILFLAELAERHSSQLRPYRPAATATEFRRMLLAELDLEREMRNIQRFAENFEDDNTVRFPEVFPELSAPRVLTMERLEGIHVREVDELKGRGEDLNTFAHQIANMYLEMLFRDGFYHADPHPGNLLFLPGGVVGVLDCGMVGHLDSHLREEVEGLLLASVEQDADELTEIVMRISTTPADVDRDRLREEIAAYFSEYTIQSVEHFDASGALLGMTEVLRRYRIVLPASLSMLIKMLVVLDGTGKRLTANFSLAEIFEPFHRRVMLRRFSPTRIIRKARRTYRDWDRLIEAFPRDLGDILRRIRHGKFDVNLNHRHLDSTVNRLVVGILTAALFMGSAMILSQRVPPVLWDVSIVGAFGCAVAIVMGFRLLLAIRHSGDIEEEEI